VEDGALINLLLNEYIKFIPADNDCAYRDNYTVYYKCKFKFIGKHIVYVIEDGSLRFEYTPPSYIYFDVISLMAEKNFDKAISIAASAGSMCRSNSFFSDKDIKLLATTLVDTFAYNFIEYVCRKRNLDIRSLNPRENALNFVREIPYPTNIVSAIFGIESVLREVNPFKRAEMLVFSLLYRKFVFLKYTEICEDGKYFDFVKDYVEGLNEIYLDSIVSRLV